MFFTINGHHHYFHFLKFALNLYIFLQVWIYSIFSFSFNFKKKHIHYKINIFQVGSNQIKHWAIHLNFKSEKILFLFFKQVLILHIQRQILVIYTILSWSSFTLWHVYVSILELSHAINLQSTCCILHSIFI